MIFDLSPSSNYKSEEKIEQDIHSKYYKFNRKTKIKKLPNDYDIKTCGDIVELFPNALNDYKFNKNGEVSLTKHDKYIWQYSFKGDDLYYGTTKYKFNWTLYYKSMEQALDPTEIPNESAEFSIRIYSINEGYGPWMYEPLEYTANLYSSILDFYDQ